MVGDKGALAGLDLLAFWQSGHAMVIPSYVNDFCIAAFFFLIKKWPPNLLYWPSCNTWFLLTTRNAILPLIWPDCSSSNASISFVNSVGEMRATKLAGDVFGQEER